MAAKLTDVRLYDARKIEIPAAAMLGDQFDATVREYATKNMRPMVVANTVHSDANGGTRTGLPLVVFGDVTRRDASITTRMTDGRPLLLVAMGDTDYTAAGLAKLNTQVAMLSPK